ncbi:MAG: hypothetical protein FWF28_06650, partial [Micrococcales bacterium]|nr:hypothetical protein [Micrococcales bacterium]
MKATVLLADAASDATGGKVSALGLGWSQTGVPTSPMAVIVLVDVGWDETNRDLAIAVELLDADGHPVRHLGSGGGPAPVRIDAK